MVKLYQRSAAKTLVNKMGLDIFVLFNIFNYSRFGHILSLHFTILMNTESVFLRVG